MTPALDMLRAVLFDLGDTLLDFEPMDTRAIFAEAARNTYQYLQSLGHPLPPFNRYRRAQYSAVRWAYFWAKLRNREFNSVQLLGSICRRLGVPLDEAATLELAWRWYAPLTDHTVVQDDVIPTLRHLSQQGLMLGLVSNTFVPGSVLDRHLDMVGLLPLLPVRVYSADLGYRKPDRRIFESALSQMQMTAANTLFVGDLVKTDVVGARRVGMRTVLKEPYHNAPRHRLADYVIRRLSELPPIVAALRDADTAA